MVKIFVNPMMGDLEMIQRWLEMLINNPLLREWHLAPDGKGDHKERLWAGCSRAA